MVIDQTTFRDLSLLQEEETFSVFHKLNFTHTLEGKDQLFKKLSQPFSDLTQITEIQHLLKHLIAHQAHWPACITNGTLMVIEKFYDSNIDTLPDRAHLLNALSYKLFHGPDFSLVRYSLNHFADFFRGMQQLETLFGEAPMPPRIQLLLERVRDLLQKPVIQKLIGRDSSKVFSWTETVFFGHFIKDHYRSQTFQLIEIFGHFDAWQSMATACRHYQLCFPEFTDADLPLIDAGQLYHLLLPQPIPYDVHMNRESNFIFLTGANMAGKSTFIKAVGCAIFLAHLGMGVPARSMQLSVFDGLLSNINVVDNIAKGESYFFNEVQRIKNTIQKINDGKKWLVLIDELFKGTNVQDAMKCSATVIRGLLKIKNSLFILSTHLYEIGQDLNTYPNISFRYFETSVQDDQLTFSYHLKEGISNDRLGYLILKREKVVELLESL